MRIIKGKAIANHRAPLRAVWASRCEYIISNDCISGDSSPIYRLGVSPFFLVWGGTLGLNQPKLKPWETTPIHLVQCSLSSVCKHSDHVPSMSPGGAHIDSGETANEDPSLCTY